MKKYAALVMAIIAIGCTQSNNIDVFQRSRDNMIDVKSNIKPIDTGNCYMGRLTNLKIANKYVVCYDIQATDKCIHVFDKNTIEHKVSFGDVGQGPYEIAMLGDLIWNPFSNEIIAIDFGTMNYYAYDIDSVIAVQNYEPKIKTQGDPRAAIVDCHFIDTNTVFARQLQATGNSGYNEYTCLWNISSGETTILEYNHPEITPKRTRLCVSVDDQQYAECNYLYDFITIFNFKGELIKNIYGPQWEEKNLECFTACSFTDKYLIASYKGEDYEQNLPVYKIEIFTKSGEYVATLNTGYSIKSFDYDKIDNRLYFVFDDVIQFGYLDLDDIQL